MWLRRVRWEGPGTSSSNREVEGLVLNKIKILVFLTFKATHKIMWVRIPHTNHYAEKKKENPILICVCMCVCMITTTILTYHRSCSDCFGFRFLGPARGPGGMMVEASSGKSSGNSGIASSDWLCPFGVLVPGITWKAP